MNKNQCQLCKGYGIIKNTDYSCDFCDGIRCDNVPKNYIYTPYVECKKCFNKETVDDINWSCSECDGSGFIKNHVIKCNYCQIDHNWCGCVRNVNPYIECTECFGSGEISI